MRLKEFATPDAQLELWKMVSDAVWAAINKQNNQQTDSSSQNPVSASRAQDANVQTTPAPVVPKPKSSAKKLAAVKLPKIPSPPPKPRKPLKPNSRAKPKRTDLPRTQAPAVSTSQRQQPAQTIKPAVTAQQPLIAKNLGFDAKTGVFQQNRRAPITPPRRG